MAIQVGPSCVKVVKATRRGREAWVYTQIGSRSVTWKFSRRLSRRTGSFVTYNLIGGAVFAPIPFLPCHSLDIQ